MQSRGSCRPVPRLSWRCQLLSSWPQVDSKETDACIVGQPPVPGLMVNAGEALLRCLLLMCSRHFQPDPGH